MPSRKISARSQKALTRQFYVARLVLLRAQHPRPLDTIGIAESYERATGRKTHAALYLQSGTSLSLEKLTKGKTVIAIAHRLSTIRNADQIVVITGGVVAESGTHDELIARNGLYAELHRTQFNAGSDRVVPATAAN